jgi:hypothetical protein
LDQTGLLKKDRALNPLRGAPCPTRTTVAAAKLLGKAASKRVMADR